MREPGLRIWEIAFQGKRVRNATTACDAQRKRRRLWRDLVYQGLGGHDLNESLLTIFGTSGPRPARLEHQCLRGAEHQVDLPNLTLDFGQRGDRFAKRSRHTI